MSRFDVAKSKLRFSLYACFNDHRSLCTDDFSRPEIKDFSLGPSTDRSCILFLLIKDIPKMDPSFEVGYPIDILPPFMVLPGHFWVGFYSLSLPFGFFFHPK